MVPSYKYPLLWNRIDSTMGRSGCSARFGLSMTEIRSHIYRRDETSGKKGRKLPYSRKSSERSFQCFGSYSSITLANLAIYPNHLCFIVLLLRLLLYLPYLFHHW